MANRVGDIGLGTRIQFRQLTYNGGDKIANYSSNSVTFRKRMQDQIIEMVATAKELLSWKRQDQGLRSLRRQDGGRPRRVENRPLAWRLDKFPAGMCELCCSPQ